MSQIPLQCEICQKYFSGPVSAQQHFESIDHQRKAASKQQAEQESDFLFCSPCSKRCNSYRQFAEHNASPQHLALVERASRFTSASSPSGRLFKTDTQGDPSVSSVEKGFLRLALDDKGKRYSGMQSYVFDGTRGYCNVCDLELNSPSHARQHLNGNKHKKKGESFVGGTLGGSLSCTLCNVPFSGPECAQQHLLSEKHLKKVKEMSGGADPGSSNIPSRTADLAASAWSWNPSRVLPSPPGAWLTRPDTALSSPQTAPHSTPVAPGEYAFDGNRGRCHVCDIELTSPQHAQQHLSGKNHKKKCLQRRSFGSSVSIPSYCEICRVHVPDFVTAQSHFASESHKQRELQQQQQQQQQQQHTIGGTSMHSSDDTQVKLPHTNRGTSIPEMPEETMVKVPVTSETAGDHGEREETLVKTPYSGGSTGSHGMNEQTLQKNPDSIQNTGSPEIPEETLVKIPFPSKSPGNLGMENILAGTFSGTSGLNIKKEHELDRSGEITGRKQMASPETTPSPVQHPQPCCSKTPFSSAGGPRTPSSSPSASVDSTDVSDKGSPSPSNHSIPYEITAEGLVCNVCEFRADNKDAISQHLEEKNHHENMKEWNQRKLFQSLEQVSSDTPGTGSPEDLPQPSVDSDVLSPQNSGSPAAPTRSVPLASTIPFAGSATGMGHVDATRVLPPEPVPVASHDATVANGYVCMICVEKFSGPVPANQHNFSENHRKKVRVHRLLQNRSPSEKDSVRPIYPEGDLTPWYPCDVCLTLMNTPSILEGHKKSPKHLEKVEKRNLFMHPIQSVTPCITTNFAVCAPSPSQQTPQLVTQDKENPQDPIDSTVHKTPEKHEMVWNALKMGHLTRDSTILLEGGNEDIFSQNSGVSAQPSAASIKQLINKQLAAARNSSPSGFAELIPASQPAVDRDPNHLSASFSQFRDPPDSDEDTSVEWDSDLSSLTASQHSLPGRENGGQTDPTSQLRKKDEGGISEPEINTESPVPVQPRFAMTSSGEPTARNEMDDSAHGGSSGGGARKSQTFNSLRNRSSRSGGRKLAGPGMGSDGDGDADGEDSCLTRDFETRCSLGGRLQGDGGDMESLASLGSQYATAPSSPVSRTVGSSSGESSSGAGWRMRPRTLGLTESTLDDGDSPEGGRLPAAVTLPAGSRSFGASTTAPATNPYRYFDYYCSTCKRPMNTKETYEAHLRGQKHRQKTASERAPQRDLGPIVKKQSKAEVEGCAKGIILKTPRSYQIELFWKAMDSNCIIFLPTGTGKTVIAAMVISRMLTLNPRRPVLFLVDKVLLVLQQGQVISKELGQQEFLRMDLNDDSKNVMREAKVAQLCGGLRGVDGTPLYKHDVIVTTAAFCENMLMEEMIRWEDFSLVVLDEAHHCVGKHPYCNIMNSRHRPLPPEKRPKVLGLTASPAGKNTLEDTITMLKNLMVSLDQALVGVVQGESQKKELEQFQSATQMTILKVDFSHEVKELCQKLKEYIVRCYLKLAEVSNIEREAPIFTQKTSGSLEDRARRHAEELDDETLRSLLVALEAAKSTAKLEERATFDYLLQHAQFVIVTLKGIEGGCGVPFAVEEFSKLSSSKESTQFDIAEKYGLPAGDLMFYVRRLDEVADVERKMEEDGVGQVTLFGELRHVLFSGEYIDWQQAEQPMALVLVRERLVAIRMSEALKKLEATKSRNLRVHHVVGHGAKTGDGMRVPQQKRVLDGMRGGRYNIVVATSVAEEGVDIPECELVVTLNPPDSVTALVQMRGRARKRGSRFVVICEGDDKKHKLNTLLTREKNMTQAAERCIHYGWQSQNK